MIPVDKLTTRDLNTAINQTSSARNSDQGDVNNLGDKLDMTIEDLKLLGFQMIEPEDDVRVEQRASKVQVTYSQELAAGRKDSSGLTKSMLGLPSTDESGSRLKRSSIMIEDGEEEESGR